MSGWEMKIIAAEARRLLDLAARDASIRAELRALAEEILAATTLTPEQGTVTVSDAPAAAPEPLRELTLGRSHPPAELKHASAGAGAPADADVEAIAANCRRKVEAVHWAAGRRRLMREGNEVSLRDAPGDAHDVDWAERLADGCEHLGAELGRLDDVAGCFEAVAEAFELVEDSRVRPRGLERALPLVAEAQSALRVALRAVGEPDDPDQRRAFEWLRDTAARQHIFLRRFMRADDLADPSGWSSLLDRIDAARGSLRSAGTSTSSREPARTPTSPHEPSAEVALAARLLRGKGVLLIGGSRRREAIDALERAFGLKELVWVETKEHQATGTFEPLIARPDVAVVLLAIRWSSHAFGDVKQFCERHGKPLVRLPGGYNPNQVAAQVLAQCSGQLAGGREERDDGGR